MNDEPHDEGTALSIFCLIIGFCVWIQVLGPGAWSEFNSPDGRAATLFIDIAPLFVLIVGAIVRSRIMLIVGFILTMIPGILLTPEHLTFQIHSGMGLVRIGGTAAFYLVGVAVAFSREHSPLIRPEAAAPSRRQLTRHRLHIAIRATLAMLFLLVIFQAVYFDPVVTQTIEQRYEHGDIATVFISLTMFFMWAAATYMFIIVPSLNYEHDRRALTRRFAAEADDPNAGLIRRNVGELMIVGLFAMLMVVL